LTGGQLHAVLEHQWEDGTSGRLLQVSQGFSYQWHPAAPVGKRVDPHSMRLNGMPIDPAAHYRVTVNDFLAGGGDGFTTLTAGTERISGCRDVDALEKYLAGHSPPPTATQSRIRLSE
jgi:5'-nucleotidase